MMTQHARSFIGAQELTASALLLVALSACGCGGPEFDRAAVQGRVTYKGQPIAEGRIQFFPVSVEEAPIVAADIKDGQYSLALDQGPLVGNNRVEINAFEKTGRQVPDLSRENRNDPHRPMIDEVRPLLPAQYNTESTLTGTIAAGENTLDFPL